MAANLTNIVIFHQSVNILVVYHDNRWSVSWYLLWWILLNMTYLWLLDVDIIFISCFLTLPLLFCACSCSPLFSRIASHGAQCKLRLSMRVECLERKTSSRNILRSLKDSWTIIYHSCVYSTLVEVFGTSVISITRFSCISSSRAICIPPWNLIYTVVLRQSYPLSSTMAYILGALMMRENVSLSSCLG